MPVVLIVRIIGRTINSHLRKQKRTIRMVFSHIPFVRSTGIKSPIPGSKYKHVRHPKRCCRVQKLQWSNVMIEDGAKQQQHRTNHCDCHHTNSNIAQYSAHAMFAHRVKHFTRQKQCKDYGKNSPTRSHCQMCRKHSMQDTGCGHGNQRWPHWFLCFRRCIIRHSVDACSLQFLIQKYSSHYILSIGIAGSHIAALEWHSPVGNTRMIVYEILAHCTKRTCTHRLIEQSISCIDVILNVWSSPSGGGIPAFRCRITLDTAIGIVTDSDIAEDARVALA